MVPVASWVSVWSIRMPISWPGVISPSTRWTSISFCATFMARGAISGPFPGQESVAGRCEGNPHDRGTARWRAAKGENMKKQAILGLVVMAASFGAALLLRQRRIKVVDTTAPDAFGSALVRESPGP